MSVFILIFGFFYVLYQVGKASMEEEENKRIARQNGWSTYCDASGRSRDLKTGNLACVGTQGRMSVYNPKTKRFEEVKR